MPTPSDVVSVRRFIGFTNYLSKFLPRLRDALEPLRKLTSPDAEWLWTDIPDSAVRQVKLLVTKVPVLKFFDSTGSLTLQCDASDKGLGAILLKKGQPTAYASRALTYAESQYVQIEKQLLAVVYGSERFHTYTYGREVFVESDHKPLEVIFKKPLHRAPKKLQRMLMREIESINMTQHIRLKPSTLQEIKDHTQKEDSLLELIKVIKAGWPETKGELCHLVLPFFDVRDELSVCDGIVIRGERVVVPKSLPRDMLYRLHYAHSGVVSTLLLARESVYWPGMSGEIKQFIEMCDVCRAFDRKQPKETLIPHEVPDRPWAKVGVDLFTYRGRNYLICVDYYSSFWEIDCLDKTTSGAVVQKLKSHFARHGIQETCVSDNGP
ncbi:Retrovirus-related Pol polyprotein from transposon 17.6 [Stylophora pistillata]|uniref:Retrovirus-related Pol polyprotein from transposon 17.6 n=1 Tax=Stylophora pistillata TaxID=50429 RepID=A0A2B4SZT3_STYPI|nr:Retrovirus-related Pol polyprotein from transposon 17.6 [Stylophora pistillata]